MCLVSLHTRALKMGSLTLLVVVFFLLRYFWGFLVLQSKFLCKLFLKGNVNTYWAPRGFRGRLSVILWPW